MSVERLQAGAQSATYLIKFQDNPQGLSTAQWSALPEGKLKDVMDRTYAPTETMSALEVFLRAFAAAGGSAVASGGPTGDLISSKLSPGWVVYPVEGGHAALQIAFDPAYPADGAVVRVSVSYSASE